VASVSPLGLTHLGLDVHKDTISVAVLAPDRDGPAVDRIPHDEPSVRRLVGRLGDPRRLRACDEAGPTGYEAGPTGYEAGPTGYEAGPTGYEAGPTGYEAGPTGYDLARLLHSMHVCCEVIAPSLIPKAPGDKARDRPARLPPAGAAVPGRGAGGDPHPHRAGRSGP
jgi:transposase